MTPLWTYLSRDEALKAKMDREVWILSEIDKDNKPIIKGIFYRMEDDKWLLVDMRDNARLSLPLKEDKTIVECKDALVKWLSQR